MEDEYRIHRALIEEMEKENGASTDQGVSEDQEFETLGVGQMSLLDDRGRTDLRNGEAPRSSSSASPGKASVNVDKLLSNLPQKADRSKSSDQKPPVMLTDFVNNLESTFT